MNAPVGDATAGERAGATLLVPSLCLNYSPMRFARFFKQGLGEEASDAILDRIGRVIAKVASRQGRKLLRVLLKTLLKRNIQPRARCV